MPLVTDHVLDGDWNAGQFRRAPCLQRTWRRRRRLFEGLVGGNLQEGLDGRFGGFDHLEVGFDELARGDVALLDGSGLLGSRQFDESCGFVAHRLLLASQDSRCHEHAGLGLRATGERLFLRERGFSDIAGAGRLPAEPGSRSAARRRATSWTLLMDSAMTFRSPCRRVISSSVSAIRARSPKCTISSW